MKNSNFSMKDAVSSKLKISNPNMYISRIIKEHIYLKDNEQYI